MSTTDEAAISATTDAARTATTTTPAPATSVDWTSTFAPDLKTMVEAKGYKTPADLAQAYAHAEKAIGADKIVLPKDGIFSDPQTRQRLGIPDAADKYQVTRPEMPEGLKYDEAFEKSMLPVAHQLGLTPAQVNGLIKAATEHRLGEFKMLAEHSNAARAAGERELKSELGAAYDQKVEIAKRAVAHFGGDGLREYLNSSGLGNHPEMIRAFAKIGAAMGEDALKGGQAQGLGLTPDQARAQRLKITQSEAYNKRDHPEHELAVRKAAELFALEFPEHKVA